MRTIILSLILAGSLLAQGRNQLSNGNFNRLRRQNCVAAWDLTTASGTTATDLSKNGNTLTKAAAGAAPTSTVTGWSFVAANSQYATGPTIARGTGDATVMVIATGTAAAANGRLWSSRATGPTRGLELYANTSTHYLDTFMADPSGYVNGPLTSTTILGNGWNGLAAVFIHAVGARGYKNNLLGTFLASASQTGSIAGGPDYVGALIGGGQFWDGTIALVSIYSVALSPGQVSHNYYSAKRLLAPAGVTLP
jgi:hypothetical protein